MIIRAETPADHQAIHDLTDKAFAPMNFYDGTEAGSIDQLRADGDLLLSLVAEENGTVVGHVAFSPAFLDCPGRWAGLGPISVEKSRQKRGIGSKLAQTGMEHLRQQGFDGCVLIGNPAVYARMGFQSGGLTYRDLPRHIVQYHSLSGLVPRGEVTFAPALEVT